MHALSAEGESFGVWGAFAAENHASAGASARSGIAAFEQVILSGTLGAAVASFCRRYRVYRDCRYNAIPSQKS